MPDASISADAIVGFPGETEEQFENTALVADIGFDQLNTAAYSPRPGTPAAVWEKLSEVKSDRLQRLNHLSRSKQSRDQRYLGRLEVLGDQNQNPSQVMGHVATASPFTGIAELKAS